MDGDGASRPGRPVEPMHRRIELDPLRPSDDGKPFGGAGKERSRGRLEGCGGIELRPDLAMPVEMSD